MTSAAIDWAALTHSLLPSHYKWECASPLTKADGGDDATDAGGAALPAPSASGAPPRIVVLFGWANGAPKHLAKYTEWYRRNGCHTIAITVQMGDLRPSLRPQRTAEMMALIRLLAAAMRVTASGSGDDDASADVCVHAFSNGGLSRYMRLLDLLDAPTPPAAGGDAEDIRRVRRAIRGVVWDSAPAAPWARQFARAYTAGVPNTLVRLALEHAFCAGMHAARALAWLWAVLLSAVCGRPRPPSDVISRMQWQPLTAQRPASSHHRWPLLAIYSAVDPITDYTWLHAFVDAQIRDRRALRGVDGTTATATAAGDGRDVDVYRLVVPNALHVQNLRANPAAYHGAVCVFMTTALSLPPRN